jgi:AAA domain
MTEVISSNLRGFNVLLEGATGTGKTYSIGTLVDSGLDVFYLGMESGMEALLGYYIDKGKPIPPNLHWNELAPAASGFGSMLKTAKQINTLSLEALCKIQDTEKSKYNSFVLMLEALNDFQDQRTGVSYGPVDAWDVDKVLVVDSLSSISYAAMSMVVGGRPVQSQGDYGIAMREIEKVLRGLCYGCRCHHVLLSHIEREVDQVLGGSKIMTSTLGAKLAPKIPPLYSDVIYTKRDQNTYTWSTSESGADLKSRNLPVKEGIKPDFKQIVDVWKKRAGLT